MRNEKNSNVYEYWQQQAHFRSNGQIGAPTGKLLISLLNEQTHIATFILHSTSHFLFLYVTNSKPAWLTQLDAPSDWRPGGRGFNPRRGRQHSFVEIDHEIFSTVILSLPLIQEGQLSVSGERMCTILVNRLED